MLSIKYRRQSETLAGLYFAIDPVVSRVISTGNEFTESRLLESFVWRIFKRNYQLRFRHGGKFFRSRYTLGNLVITECSPLSASCRRSFREFSYRDLSRNFHDPRTWSLRSFNFSFSPSLSSRFSLFPPGESIFSAPPF